ncbi:mammalian cell entry protein [Mycolicibacterium moriokaense]|nr:mammalian cell entry protein [Mycolicibacterium moriokaense]MCV7042175.1 mammalian cell entry protein [Mycolicibacterium moriokaense]ORB19044.1 mammalian cell entry protein [Mycolicibacterium moriokaense]
MRRPSVIWAAIVFGVAVIVTLAFVGAWLGHGVIQTRQAHVQNHAFIEAAQQGVLNMTTIDYAEVDADIQRILDTSTGSFHDDFQQRSQSFIDVVKEAKSKSEGSIIASGLESQDGDNAQVLVAVSVKTSSGGVPEQSPRTWRMRVSVAKVGGVVKVSDVRFVP